MIKKIDGTKLLLAILALALLIATLAGFGYGLYIAVINPQDVYDMGTLWDEMFGTIYMILSIIPLVGLISMRGVLKKQFGAAEGTRS